MPHYIVLSVLLSVISGPRDHLQEPAPPVVRAHGCVELQPSWYNFTERWLRGKQHPDGYWRYDDRYGTVDAGHDSDRIRATAMTLLCFLSFGQTPHEGQSKQIFKPALAYLARELDIASEELTVEHGDIATLAMAALLYSELHHMTGKEQWRAPAEQLLVRLALQQNSVDGGFPRMIGQPGDLRTTTWAAMAFRSAELHGLGVPAGWQESVRYYLATNSAGNGVSYRFANEAPSRLATAMGLYCQLLTGMAFDDPQLQSGLEAMALTGESTNDTEFMFFRQQLVYARPKEGKAVGRTTTDGLRQAQDTNSVEPGSWYFPDVPSGRIGGRLQQTQFATLTMMTYYRHLPLMQAIQLRDQQ